jgi:hypothetical protein
MYNTTIDQHLSRSKVRIKTNPKDFERLLIERDFTKKEKIQNNGQANLAFNPLDKDTNQGEITGNAFDISQLEQGMPIRSNYQISEPKLESNPTDNTDFNIFDQKPSSEFNVEYDNTGFNMSYSTLDEIEAESADPKSNAYSNTYSSGPTLDPIESYVTTINEFSFFLLSRLSEVMNSEFVISPYLVISLFSLLYIAADNTTNTKDTIKDYFSFINKDLVSESMYKLFSDSENIFFKNIMIYNKNLQPKHYFINSTKHICDYNAINDTVVNTLNNKYMKHFDNIISHNSLIKNPSLLCINAMNAKAILNIQVDKIFTSDFNNSEHDFVSISNQNIYYLHSDEITIIELNLADNKHTFGLLFNNNSINNLSKILNNNELINSYLNKIKLTKIKKLDIPIIQTKTKLNLKSVLCKFGLHDVINNCSIPEMFSQPLDLNSIVQNISFTFNGDFVRVPATNKSTKILNEHIILNHTFNYYIRNKEYGHIILSGLYS